jgi:hypothetical protein
MQEDDSEMIMSYEKRIAEMLMSMQKLERESLFKDEEIKSIKNIAREAAGQLESVTAREAEFRAEILRREERLEVMAAEMASAKRDSETMKTQMA